MHAVHDMLSSNLAQLVAERRALVGRLQVLFGCSSNTVHAFSKSNVLECSVLVLPLALCL